MPNLIELNNQNKSVLNDVSASIENNKCHVCESDKLLGLNFGGISCTGCRKFFQRTVMLKKQYKCFFINECLVNQKTVNHCQSCRYNKCLAINMSPNKVDIQHSINNLKDYDKENIQNTVKYNNPDKEPIRESINDSKDIENKQQTVKYNNPNFSTENLSNYEKIFIDKITSVFTNSCESIPIGLNINKKNDELYKKVARYAFSDFIGKITNKFVKQIDDYRNLEIHDQSKLLHSAGVSIFIWQFYINYQSDIIDHCHLIWDENVIEKTKSFLNH